MYPMSTAFVLANISLIFTVVEDSDPSKMGSRGVGFTVDQGVTASVSLSDSPSILFNNTPIDFPTVQTVLEHLQSPPAIISLTSPLPLGYGFGLSGASALATAFALNDLLKLQKSKLNLAKIAHVAEVINKTGLGDVANQYVGGFCVKWVNSAEFKVDHLPFEGKTVYYRVFSPLSTKTILSDKEKKEKVNKAGNKTLLRLKEMVKGELTLEDIFKLSKQFCLDSDLIQDTQVMQTINEIENNGGKATMILLGNGVVSTIPFTNSKPLKISIRENSL